MVAQNEEENACFYFIKIWQKNVLWGVDQGSKLARSSKNLLQIILKMMHLFWSFDKIFARSWKMIFLR